MFPVQRMETVAPVSRSSLVKSSSSVINLCETKDARGNKVQVGQCNADDDEAKCIGGTNETINKVLCECSADWMGDFCDMSKLPPIKRKVFLDVIIYNVMMALYGRMDYTLLPVSKTERQKEILRDRDSEMDSESDRLREKRDSDPLISSSSTTCLPPLPKSPT